MIKSRTVPGKCYAISDSDRQDDPSQNEDTFLQKNLIGLLYCDLLADVCISRDLTLFCSVSFYFVYFSCTAQIHMLKFKSEYYFKVNI